VITVSIVSHGHGSMLPNLISQILNYPEVSQIILTLNISELVKLPKNSRLILLRNDAPKGFGANHNTAFKLCTDSYFCVLNPDVTFIDNPFPKLLESQLVPVVGLVAPMIINPYGKVEDSARKFPTPLSIIKRKIFSCSDVYSYNANDSTFAVEWVAGMFMLFKAEAYGAVNGFDENYFLYVEDVDICTRLWQKKYKLLVNPSAYVVHDARRGSKTSLRHFSWHLSGIIRYFSTYIGRYPKVF
jgi:GT2 family glycosyltransferase